MNGPPFKHCFEPGFNQGHFVEGRFVPDCKMCGKCCEGFWLNSDKHEDWVKFDLMHRGTERIGNVIYVYAPCRHLLNIEGVVRTCALHDSDRPESCEVFGYGNYFHPPNCAFFGGTKDAEYNPQVPQ
jgi:hypothetical protein